MDVLKNYYDNLIKNFHYPSEYLVLEKNRNSVKIQDEAGEIISCLNFCANDVLGLSTHAAVKAAAIQAIEQYGTSNSGSSGLNGKNLLHKMLEQEVADLKGLRHSHLFINAWAAVPAFLEAFCNHELLNTQKDSDGGVLILGDQYNHGCIMSACKNISQPSRFRLSNDSPADFYLYRHLDLADLRRKAEKHLTENQRLLVMTDGVFSMDGDVAPIKDLIDLLSSYKGSVLFIDEAHSTGSLGPNGKGVLEHFGISSEYAERRGVELVIMTTFSKFAGSAGAAIATNSFELVRLMNLAPTSLLTISIPPAQTAATLKSIEILKSDKARVERLAFNRHVIRSRLKENGFDVLGETTVIPIVLDNSVHPRDFARHLLYAHNIWISAVWSIAAPTPRLRAVANSEFDLDEIEAFVDGMIYTREYFSRARKAV